MKKLWLFLLLFPALAYSQDIKVRRIEQITRKTQGEFIVSGVSPDGKQILASSADFKGLKIIDLKKKRIRDVTADAGSGYEPAFSPDGNKIFFRSDEYRNSRKYSSLYKYDRSNGTTSLIEPASRGLGSPVITGERLIYSTAGTQKSRITGKDEMQKGQIYLYVILEDLVPYLYINGVKKEFKPNGEGNYIWASLSPDKTKVLYNFRGTSSFVSDTAGKILTEIGRLNAPKWITDDLIVGMNDVDDGTSVISSDICCYSLKTNKLQRLTSTDRTIEMYPCPVPGGNTIAFQTLSGELFLMHIKIR
ncbi:MAG: hypothetical protein NT092_03220 [Bacteroidia bacterium]|nr:hypothetical protein [Bacteroidia bacterium]